ncbi:hypothetical protein [Nereida sp. MMG025]|uniref:hypothetical protein n=1 Tax=Nereida sp. MMG025 TaxID=2909981 RepID=UPI001F16944A|nr:hypothetical protein [Nereida sp. MMG025]MCF6445470.1 hypothetical protein [Nereida sp. MMG025]
MWRLVIILLVVLTIIYVSLSLYSRAARREKLRAQWRENLMVGDRDAWVQEGLEAYDKSLRRKLILGVYVVPIVGIAAMIYVQNFM